MPPDGGISKFLKNTDYQMVAQMAVLGPVHDWSKRF